MPEGGIMQLGESQQEQSMESFPERRASKKNELYFESQNKKHNNMKSKNKKDNQNKQIHTN